MGETYAGSPEAAKERVMLFAMSGPLGAMVVAQIAPSLWLAGFFAGIATATVLLYGTAGLEDGDHA